MSRLNRDNHRRYVQRAEVAFRACASSEPATAGAQLPPDRNSDDLSETGNARVTACEQPPAARTVTRV